MQNASKPFWHSVTLALGLFLAACNPEPVDENLRFAHITDPHLYDLEGKNVPSPPPDEGCLNFAMLQSVIARLNLENGLKPLSFVVVTGDIGIEKLIEKAIGKPCTSTTLTVTSMGDLLFDGVNHDQAIQREFRDGALKLASVLRDSAVKDWLFVNGNNDLCNEDATSAFMFSRYMNELQIALSGSGISIHNLIGDSDFVGTFSPRSNTKHSFIGFENGSWKNNQDAEMAAKNYDFQLKVLQALETEVYKQENLGKNIHLLFHVPSFDDPFNAATASQPCDKRLPTTATFSNNCTRIQPKIETNLPTNIYSAWLVRDDFRSRWDALADRQSIKNFFAGHFHVAKRDFYEQLGPWQTQDYPNLAKYNVASPVAIKNQILSDTVDQARGFTLIEIEASGAQSVRDFAADQFATYQCPDNVEITPWEEHG